MLLPKDLERYLGIRTLNSKAVQDALTLASSPRPRPLASLASREQLHSWLSRLLLSLIWSGKAQARPNTIKLPNNLVVFVKLMYELRDIGYPSHWLSDFLHAVFNGTLQVDHSVYRDKTPRPVSDIYKRVSPYRVRLDPWYAELAMLLTSTGHCLPFAVQIPDALAASPDEIGAFRANPARNMHALESMMAFPRNDNVFAMLFYRPDEAGLRDSSALRSFIPGLPSVIEGKTTPPPGTFHVLTTLDALDLGRPVPEVRWKMSRTLTAKMRRERWMFVLWRMDFHSVGTCPLSAGSGSAADFPFASH